MIRFSISDEVVPFGTRQLNQAEIDSLAKAISNAAFKRRKEALEANGGGLWNRGEAWACRRKGNKPYYNATYCFQPHSGCECAYCDVYLDAFMKLQLSQDSAWRLAEALKSKVGIGGLWMPNVSVLEFFTSERFAVQRLVKRNVKVKYILPFDVNVLPLQYIIDESRHMHRWGLRSVLEGWRGEFSMVRNLLLNEICQRKASIYHPSRLIDTFASLCFEKGETVVIHVEELRRRIGRRRLGDLIKIVYSIKPKWIQPDEDFESILSMKMIASSSDRVKYMCKSLLRDFNSQGKLSR